MTSEKLENLKQPIVQIEIENYDAIKAKNADKLIENDNDTETRIHTDILSNRSDFYKIKESYIKRIQSAFRRYKNKKLSLGEKNLLNENLKKEENPNYGNIEEKHNFYIRKSLKDNNSAFYFSNNSLSDISLKDDSKGIIFKAFFHNFNLK